MSHSDKFSGYECTLDGIKSLHYKNGKLRIETISGSRLMFFEVKGQLQIKIVKRFKKLLQPIQVPLCATDEDYIGMTESMDTITFQSQDPDKPIEGKLSIETTYSPVTGILLSEDVTGE